METPGVARRASRLGPHVLGDLLALLATVLWAGSFILARGLRDDIPPVALNFWRWLIASLVVLPFTIRPTVASAAAVRRHWRYLALAALLGVTVYNTLVYVAGRTTEAVNLALIAVCTPIFIVALARLFGAERITRARVFGIVLAAAGVVTLVTDGSLQRLTSVSLRTGDFWMLAATVVFASYSLLIGRRPAELPTAALVLCTFGLGTLFALPAYLIELVTTGSFELTGSTVAALAYVGIGASVVAFVAWNKAIDLAGAARPALIYYLVPVFTAIGGFFFLRERIGLVDGASMALIVCGTVIGTRGGNSNRAGW